MEGIHELTKTLETSNDMSNAYEKQGRHQKGEQLYRIIKIGPANREVVTHGI